MLHLPCHCVQKNKRSCLSYTHLIYPLAAIRFAIFIDTVCLFTSGIFNPRGSLVLRMTPNSGLCGLLMHLDCHDREEQREEKKGFVRNY